MVCLEMAIEDAFVIMDNALYLFFEINMNVFYNIGVIYHPLQLCFIEALQ